MPCRLSVLDLLREQHGFDTANLPPQMSLGIDYYCASRWPHAQIAQQVHIDYLTDLALGKLREQRIVLSPDEFRTLRRELTDTLSVKQALKSLRPNIDFGFK